MLRNFTDKLLGKFIGSDHKINDFPKKLWLNSKIFAEICRKTLQGPGNSD
jgi:hypothetical protein